MDLSASTSDELLIQSLGESEMSVEYIDSICLDNTIVSENSAGETVSTSSGTSVPITFILSDSGVSNIESVVTLSSEDLDIAKESIKINASPPRSQFSSDNSQSTSNSFYTIRLMDNGSKKPSDAKNCNGLGLSQGNKELDDDDKDDLIAKIDLDIDSIKHQSDLHIMETTTRLEEFMDVVTTYKCKFCRFSCPWKSGLMSHIRNCHMDANKRSTASEVHNYASAKRIIKKPIKVQELEEHGYSQSPDSKEENKNPKIASSSEETDPDIPALERHIFLCGQCSEGFEFLEDCKNHMAKEHKLKLGSSPDNDKGKSVTCIRKLGRLKSQPIFHKIQNESKSSDENVKRTFTSSLENDSEISLKRTSRPPKLLEEDYILGEKKRRVCRENSIDKPYRCHEKGCGYRFSTECHLDYHLSCHSYSDRPFICPECGESFEYWRGLSVHLWKEHSVDVDLHTCSECGYKTYSLFKLDNHKKIHSDERSFVCETCNKGFKQLSQLRNHVVIHSDRKNMVEKRWYSEQKCEVCSRTFSDSKCLKKHLQAVHSKLKPFVCTFCGHMSARKAMLQLHMRQHTGEKPFVCDHCEYRTGDHNSLRRHRMRHTGIKPYKCPHCPYACIQAISYKTHLKNKHPGLEGLYACSMCSFHSVSKENYFNHVSDHRRGAIPGIPDVDDDLTSVVGSEVAQQPAQMHIPDDALQQLEGILPGNVTAAQLIYSCLNALSQENGLLNLPPGVTTTSTSDGTQTITIQIPGTQEVENDEKYYLTVQQEGSETAVLLPPTEEDLVEQDPNIAMEVLRPITIMHEGTEVSTLDAQSFINIGQEPVISIDVSSLSLPQADSITVSENSKAMSAENEKCII